MAAKVLGLKAVISRLSAEVVGLRGQVKACHELLDKKDITIRNMETDKRVAQERTSAIYVESLRRLEVERDGLREALRAVVEWQPNLPGAPHRSRCECVVCTLRGLALRALSTSTGTAATKTENGCVTCEDDNDVARAYCAKHGEHIRDERDALEGAFCEAFFLLSKRHGMECPTYDDATKTCQGCEVSVFLAGRAPGGGLPVTGEGP